MRKLLSITIAVLFVGTLGACEEQPTRLDQEVKASHSGQDVATHIAHVRTWGDLVDTWEFLVPQATSPADEESTAPLWVIEPVDDADSPHASAFFGPHDHVVPVPPQNGGTFSAMWHVHLVTEGPPEFNEDGEPTNLTNSADIDGDGTEELLTSHARVQKAVDMELVTSVPLEGVFFPCPVQEL